MGCQNDEQIAPKEERPGQLEGCIDELPTVSISYEKISGSPTVVKFNIISNECLATISFGDRSTPAIVRETVYHRYPQQGIYTVKVSVENQRGKTEASVCVDLDPGADCI